MSEDAIPTSIGKWTVVGFVDTRTLKRTYCRCTCGVIRQVPVSELVNGGTRCGACDPELDPRIGAV
jgi:hypothetical protein